VGPQDELSFMERSNADFSNPEQIFIKQEDIHRLNAAIDRLTGIQKTTVLLFYKDELSLEEISSVLEIPVNTVKSHLHRARNSLKQIITQNMEL
jgi:RNA polymerase sigma-70 factor (ECF subfamily)